MTNTTTKAELQQILKSKFGYQEFRDQQLPIMEGVLGGRDTLVLMPTGGGKSLCYQIPALAMEGTTVVISPLIALMKDQVDGLKLNGIEAEFLNSSQTSLEQTRVLQLLMAKRLKLLYLAPERLMANNGELLFALKEANINLFAIDEAHCISQWGHDFRPEYLKLAALKQVFQNTPIIALTATADQRTRENIIANLRLNNPEVFTSSFNRANIEYHVEPKQDSKHRLLEFLRERRDDSGIIYSLSRKSTESISEFINANGFNSKPYHAGLSQEEKDENQNLFLQDSVPIIVATIAFGMGIDKSNVRYVVHMDLPKNMEGYYQETGRAGRDGLPSTALLFFSRGDAVMLKKFIENSDPEQAAVLHRKLDQMVMFGETVKCRREYILQYFDENFKGPCGACDRCLNVSEWMDGTIIAQKALSAVYRLNQTFGAGYVIDFLRGSKAEKIREEHKSIKTYGVGKDIARNAWVRYINNLIELGYLEQSTGQYPVLKLTAKSKGVLQGGEKVELVKLVERKKKAKEVTTEYAEDLYNYLKEWRYEMAQHKKVPPYVIFSDKTLIDLAAYLPEKEEDLFHISGLGEVKVSQYGEDILKIIKQYCQKNGLSSKMHLVTKTLSPKNSKKAAAKAGLSETEKTTIKFFKQGMDIPAIVKKREVTVNTIENHLASGVKWGVLKAEELVSPQKIKDILSVLQEVNSSGLKAVKEALPENFSYGEIKIVLASKSDENG